MDDALTKRTLLFQTYNNKKPDDIIELQQEDGNDGNEKRCFC
jgi:hypothetical protein